MSTSTILPVAFRCTNCWQTTCGGSDDQGKNVPCLSCGQQVTVPEPTPERVQQGEAFMLQYAEQHRQSVEAEAEQALLAKMEEEKLAKEVELEKRLAEKTQLAQEAMANRLAELSPVAVQGMKEMMVRASNLDYTAIDQITEVAQNRVMNSQDRKEGARAFMERRPVEWPGE